MNMEEMNSWFYNFCARINCFKIAHTEQSGISINAVIDPTEIRKNTKNFR